MEHGTINMYTHHKCRCDPCKAAHAQYAHRGYLRKQAEKMKFKLDECTYFDQRQVCSVCGARPAMRKTGKCTPHSVDPVDMSRADDWIDCYEGCMKHDKDAHKSAMQRKYDHARPNRKHRDTKEPLQITPLPTINKLFLMHRQPAERREQYIAKAFMTAIDSRRITQIDFAKGINRTPDWIRCRVYRGSTPMSFMDVCDTLEYLQEWDQKYKMDNYKP